MNYISHVSHLAVAALMSCVFVGCSARAAVLAGAGTGSIVEFGQTVFEITESGQDTLGKTLFVHGRSLKSIKKIEFNVKCACFEPSLERSAFSPGEDVPLYIHVEFLKQIPIHFFSANPIDRKLEPDMEHSLLTELGSKNIKTEMDTVFVQKWTLCL